VEKKPRKSTRIELSPEPKKEPRKPAADQAEDVELTVNELEERVTPRPIGTFF